MKFDLDFSSLSFLEDRNKILEMIAKKIQLVYEEDPSKFYDFLYRFDLPEEKVLQYLEGSSDYLKISALIWDRQIKKMQNW